jgi:beta-lactamase regulating signal transducer with metallopeptidase domain/HEAT repeat protein
MQVIGWALIHSLWEGGIIAALVALAFSLTRTSRASVRYALGMLGLGAMVILPIATAARSTIAFTPSKAETTAPAVASGNEQSPADVTTPSVMPRSAPVSENHAGQTAPVSLSAESFLTKLEPSLPWIVVAWLVGLLFLSARMIYGVARTRRIVREAHTPASDRLPAIVSRIAASLGITRAITALEGTHVTVPMVVGWIRPVLIVPASLMTGLTPTQLDMLVAHELAHIRRYDYLANMAQTVIETMLFFHPGVWWLSERIREERENCCDDVALSVCGNDRKAYTEALLALEESRDDFSFAAAASGRGDRGSLLRRAMRLLSGGPAHLDLGARWIAGVITILAALFTTGPAVGKAADIPIASRLDVLGMLASEPDTVDREKYGSNSTLAAPDTVITYGGSGSFGDRWQWASDRARSLRSTRYWVGYLVAGDPTQSSMVYSDRDVPVRSGTSTFRGRMKFGDPNNLIFAGAQLRPLFGVHASTSTAIFLEFERAGGNDKLARVHIGSYRFPVYFNREPALWIDSASDAESITKLRTLESNARSLELRKDLISAIGMHRDAGAMVPPLIGWIDSPNEPESIRREAIDALGDIPDPRALAILSRVARSDRSATVSKEAVEAFEGMRLPAATDTLMAFATSLPSSRLRHAAIESLGGREEERIVTFLKRLASTSRDYSDRKDAVEALGSMDELGSAAIAELARTAPDAEIRAVAVEELANMEPADRALDILSQIVRADSDQRVRLKAVETMGEVKDSRASATLVSLVRQSPDINVQIKATEALGDAADTENDVKALVTLAQTHPRVEVRKKAIETLGDVSDDRLAGNALVSIVRSDPDPEVRRQAMETYTDNADPAVAVAFLKEIIANDRSERIRFNALEMLAELDHDAGIPALRELARSAPDERVRARATQLLTEH